MSEWFMELVLKTSDAARHRGFESLSLRQFFNSILSWRSTQVAVRGSPAKGVGSAKGREGSNPSFSAILTKRYRCVWRKVRRINRFRAFSSPDFFSQTIDANRCFRASAPIRTGRFPVSCRCVQPAPFFSGDFSGWQRYFSQKRITKIWASFCWS